MCKEKAMRKIALFKKKKFYIKPENMFQKRKRKIESLQNSSNAYVLNKNDFHSVKRLLIIFIFRLLLLLLRFR